MMNQYIKELLNSFESSTKNKKQKYNDFLAHVYTTFDKKISLGKKENKRKK